jgi:type IV fimbrial biogenesis protein FimT
MRYEYGVTLLETMMTVSIAAVVAVTAVPGMVELVRDARRDASVVDMVSFLNYARSEAIVLGHRVTLCPSEDGVSCLGLPLWEMGWIAFADRDGDGAVDVDETVLRIHGTLPPSNTLRGGRRQITYQSTGFSAGYNDTLELCDDRGNLKAKSVVVSMQGRVRVKLGAAGCP